MAAGVENVTFRKIELPITRVGLSVGVSLSAESWVVLCPSSLGSVPEAWELLGSLKYLSRKFFVRQISSRHYVSQNSIVLS